MNTIASLFRRLLVPLMTLAVCLAAPKAFAVDALLLQDTYVDSNQPGTNFGMNGSVRVAAQTQISIGADDSDISKAAFLKFSIATIPPGITAADIAQARLTLWVNSSSVTSGAIM